MTDTKPGEAYVDRAQHQAPFKRFSLILSPGS